MLNPTIKLTHISEIKSGDTIRHNGEMRTVSGTDIKGDSFIGKTLFGDNYNIGYKSVEMVIFK
jgi:hypothetical protein